MRWSRAASSGEWHETIGKLVPQIRHWLDTGFVAAGKIINPAHPGALFDCPRQGGQVRRVRTVLGDRTAARRIRPCDHGRRQEGPQRCDLRCPGGGADRALFGKAPRSYAYDRAGHSERNVDRLREIGVRDVGLAPRGNTPWEVEGALKARLIKERALVEGSIGTVKCPKYGFNRPAARSVAMMGVCGQRAVLGLNLTKLARGAAKNRGIALAS